MVVNESELAEAIVRLRGEWAERSGGELHISTQSWNELVADSAIDADLIVFPSRYVGELCVRGWLRPVRQNVLESPEVDAADIFPLVRRELIRWNGQTMALPLGIRPPSLSTSKEDAQALSLLVTAAPHVASQEFTGMLFDTETMAPRITEPPFVDALTRLTQAPNDASTTTPAQTSHVPVLGYSDRVAAVTTASRNAASAFQLLAWLASAEISSQLASAGERVLSARSSLVESARWYDPALTSSERAKLAESLNAIMSAQQCLLVPRIPGVDEYLAALNEAVTAAVTDEATPQAALQQAAERWQQITEAHGRDSQQDAYLKHAGISEQ
jgi:hypothetical protein